MAPRERQPFLLSIVAAVYNEAECLRELVAQIDQALADLRCEGEIVLVDDGSTDDSFRIIEDLAAKDERIRGLRLGRNEGHQSALMLGIRCARGDVVITLDADLQHPPAHIPRMVEAWKQGFDVVHMHRSSDRQGPVRVALSAAFYALFNRLSDIDVPPRSTDFRLLDRRCIEALSEEWNRKRFLRAAARRIGFRQTELLFEAPARFAGQSSYTLPRLVLLAARAFASTIRNGSS